MERGDNAWVSPQLPGFRLSPLGTGEGNEFTLVLAGREEEIFSGEDLQMYGGRSSEGLTTRLQELHETLVVWDLDAQLRAYEMQLAEIRDHVKIQSDRRSAHLERVANDLMALRVDALPFLHDLRAFRATPSLLGAQAYSFHPVRRDIHGEAGLIDFIHEDVLDRASALQELIKDVGETLATATNLRVATIQARLGARVFWFTVILAILAALTLLVAALPLLVKFVGTLRGFWPSGP
jgi:hypothetical protein